MSRTPRRLVDALVALLIVTLAFVGFARPASAYPPGQALTVSVKALIQTANANRVEFIVRKAKPGATVRMQFEEVSKNKPANSQGIAVFSFTAPASGVHIGAATSLSERASARLYVTEATLLRTRAAAGSTNYVTVNAAKPGTIVTAKIGDKSYSATVGSNYRGVITVKVPAKGMYTVKVFVGTTLFDTLSGRSL